MRLTHCFFCLALVAAAGGHATGSHAQTAKFVVRVGHLEAPTQPRHKGLQTVAALVKERTRGEVELVIYPASQLGNARQMLEATQFGSMEGTVMPAAFIGGFNPVASILDIPYLYPTDRALTQQFREGAFGKALLQTFTRRGFVAIAIWPNGRKSITSNKALDQLDAFKGQKFRVMDSRILIEQFRSVGASAIAINFAELYTSLQTGLIDGQENPLDTIVTMKFHEVQKYLVVSEHGAMEDIFLFNPAWWAKLPPSHREAIVQAVQLVRPEVERLKEQAQSDSLKVIRASGKVAVRIADETERKALREVMAPPARSAYLERGGEEGKRMLDLYNAESRRLGL